MYLMRHLGKIHNLLLEFSAIISGIMVTMMVVLTLSAVFMRYIVHNPLAWDIEITGYLLLYTPLFGAAWLLKEDGHICVEIVYEKLSHRNRILLDIIISLIITFASLIITWYAFNDTLDNLKRHAIMTGTLEFPKAALTAVITFGFLTVTIEAFRQFVKHLKLISSTIPAETKEAMPARKSD
jgi:TRAP-type C4-dicarboxylate transport system permease small subunit